MAKDHTNRSGKYFSIRLRIWQIIEAARKGDKASRVFDTCLLTLIILNVFAVIFGTVSSVGVRFGRWLWYFEILSIVVFTIEYLIRLWACTADPKYERPVVGRMRFAVRPASIVDLAAVLPFYLPFVGVDLRIVRVLRLLRAARVAKVGRYYTSLRIITRVVRRRREELVMSISMTIMLLIVSASFVYYSENPVQPNEFPNIPVTLWWSISAVTSVSYGSVYPVTAMGKLFAAITAVLGIGVFALPTGILGAGFVEELQRRRGQFMYKCPGCGMDLKQMPKIHAQIRRKDPPAEHGGGS